MPIAKQARQIWTEKLGLVHPLHFSGVIFREIGHLATIPIFWSNQCKKVQIIKHEWTPEIYKIKLYCIVIILYRMYTKNQKKHTPPKAAASSLTLLLFPMCTKPRARYKIPSRQTNATDRDSRADRTAPVSKRFLLPNITYILIIHSGSVARTVPIKNHGQDSSTSQLESIRFKYLRLK